MAVCPKAAKHQTTSRRRTARECKVLGYVCIKFRFTKAGMLGQCMPFCGVFSGVIVIRHAIPALDQVETSAECVCVRACMWCVRECVSACVRARVRKGWLGMCKVTCSSIVHFRTTLRHTQGGDAQKRR